jgi:O-antigen/teichoic acid export membrane protein
MLIMPYNGSTARVLTGSALSAPEMALFGFAQGFSDLIGRYLPVNLFSGIVRPVLTARYVRDGRFQDIVATSNLMFKVSGAISLLIAVAVYSGGAPMLTLATNGKYGDGHVGLLLLICAVVFMYAFRMSLDQVCNAVERNGPLIWSNVVITSSVLPGILLLPIVGVYALPLSTLGGLVVGCIVLHWRLKVVGFQYRHDFPGLARLGAAVVFAMLAADATRWAGAPWQLALVAGIVSYIVAVLVLRPASTHDRNIVRAILRRQ